MIGSQSILNTIVRSIHIEENWESRKKKILFYDFYEIYYDNLAEKIREKDCFKMYHFCSHVKKSGLDVVHAWAEYNIPPEGNKITIFYDNGMKSCLSNCIEYEGIYNVNLEKIGSKYIENIEYYTSNKILVEYDVEKNFGRLKKICLNGSLFDAEELEYWAKIMYILMFCKEYDEGIYDIENINIEDEYNDFKAILFLNKPPICKNIIELYILFVFKNPENNNHTLAIFTINEGSKLLIMRGRKGIKSCLAILDIDNKRINIFKRYKDYAYGFGFHYILWNGEVVPLISTYDDKGTRLYMLNKDNYLNEININDIIIYVWFVGSKDYWYFIFYEIKYNGRVLYKYDELYAPRFLKVIDDHILHELFMPGVYESLANNKTIYFGYYNKNRLIFKYILSHPTTTT